MPIDSFQTVNWTEEDVDPDKLNAMSSNIDWLYNHLPVAKFSSYGGVKRDVGVRIGSGIVTVPPSTSAWQHIRVEFDDLFTTNCKPVIVCTLTSPQQGRCIISIFGFRGLDYVPLQDGFVARLAMTDLNPKGNYFAKTMYLNWIAVGY